jgi:16S rRNA (guanine527-N7)-methyltransferase
MSDLNKLLLDGSKQMHTKLTDTQSESLVNYIELIIKWNKTYNLSAIRNPSEGIKKHLLDSLSILPFINDRPLLDVGSGAGLPGIVIAIMNPEILVSVLDSVGKKCHFMQFVKSQLCIKNLNVLNYRVEEYTTSNCFGQITSRAFAGVDKTINLTKHLLCSDGHYILMKGERFEQENIEGLSITKHKISVPYVSDDRYVVQINRQQIQ